MFYLRLLSIFFLSAFFLSISSHDAFAVTDRCPRHQVKTELKAKHAKTRFFSGSLQSINDYLNSHSVLAFVQNPLSVKTYYDFSTKSIGHGKYCVMLDRVKVEYRSSPRVVMPSDLKKKSCEYKIIRKHEQRHLDVHHDYHEKSTPQYRAFLGRIARYVPVSQPVTDAAGAQEMQMYIQNYFEEQFYTLVSNSIEEMYKQQRKIDSVQEYTFTGRKIDRCQDQADKSKKQNKKSFNNHKSFNSQ